MGSVITSFLTPNPLTEGAFNNLVGQKCICRKAGSDSSWTNDSAKTCSQFCRDKGFDSGGVDTGYVAPNSGRNTKLGSILTESNVNTTFDFLERAKGLLGLGNSQQSNVLLGPDGKPLYGYDYDLGAGHQPEKGSMLPWVIGGVALVGIIAFVAISKGKK